MQIDLLWLLLALPVTFGAGWIFSRLDVRHWRIEARHKPLAYFRGLNHLLSGEQDKAVDCFIEAVQNDPDTSELHFTLGNLFRRRGEYARAVRVHEHLLARADISPADRDRAQFALAQDYWRAGLLDRAELALVSSSEGRLLSREAQELLLLIYERGRDWDGAVKVAQALGAKAEQSHYRKRHAHYLCEQNRFAEAIAISPDSPRAYMVLANQAVGQSQNEVACRHFAAAFEFAPQAAPLFAAQWLAAAQGSEGLDNAIAQLRSYYAQERNIDVLDALIAFGGLNSTDAYRAHLSVAPSLRVAMHLIQAPEVQEALQTAAQPLSRYRCVTCGFETKHYYWQCPGCQAWDTYPFQRIEDL